MGKLVHLVPDKDVNPTGAYVYSMEVPNVECDVDEATAAELVAGGAFHLGPEPARAGRPDAGETDTPSGTPAGASESVGADGGFVVGRTKA
jgi:hypothetical protein